MKFKVAKEVFELLPTACFGIVAAKEIDNSKEIPQIREFLDGSIETAYEKYKDIKVKNLEEIQPYKEAFRKIGINPNRYQCSIEALLDRIAKGKGMPHINSAVDLGNAVSLKYYLPIGAHDMSTVEEALEVRPSKNGDTFIPFGQGEAEIPEEGEIVYVSGSQVRTRRWTFRQSEVGKITTDTNSILFPLDGFTGFNEEQVIEARDTLAEALETYFGVKVETGLINKDNLEFVF